MKAFLVVLVLAAGCVGTETVTCDDGRTCPAATACDVTHHICVLPAQLSECVGKADKDACSYDNVTGAVCLEGVCVAPGCGNKIVEDTEACDDGNTERGDGCSADCVSNETCGNGVIDAVNNEGCDDGNANDDDACHSTCQQPICGDGIVDSQYKEQCDAGELNSLLPDAPCRPNCLSPRCGDGVMDAGEVCDDNNAASGDGCSFDCRSNETCGNNELDYVNDEQCDDGDDFAGDGCSRCLPERAVWREAKVAVPPNRYTHAMTYDAARGKVVMFGGRGTAANLRDTWEWDGRVWENVTPALGNPGGRVGHAMAYDTKRGRVVMFGGEGETSNAIDETWEWDGRKWMNVTPSSGNPTARRDHAMAYDPIRGKVVLFSGNAMPGDTWEWDGTAWKDVTPASGNPPARSGHALAFDAKRGRVVMFGGRDGATPLADTWEWNGTSWTDVTPASGNPSPRYEHTMVYDATTTHLLVYGGRNNTLSLPGDVWEWNGSAWTNVTPGSGNPSARQQQAAAFDSLRGRMVVFGGQDFNGTTIYGDTNEWDGTWHPISNAVFVKPSARAGAMVAYDAARGRVVMFGGGAADYLGDTWEWDGSRWSEVTPASGNPPARYLGAMAYDAIQRRVVLFGGVNDTGSLQDTWTWNGTAWSNVTPGSGNPPARRYHAMAYDASHGRVVLFGGANSSNARLDDTWLWNGSAWTDATPTSGNPPARARSALAYDPTRQTVVMFGGTSATGFLNDTWEWNGTTWMNKTLTGGNPTPRYSHTLAYDPVLGRTVMFGGAGTSFLDETWLWDGTTWTNATLPTGNPPSRFLHASVADPARGGVLIFGGDATGSSVLLDDTWTFRYESNQGHETCVYGIDGDGDGKVGCADAECFGFCNPLCPPGTTCDPAWPRCGDGICAGVETKRLCPADCGAPVALCGDFLCDAGETNVSCPGDCAP